MSYLTAIDRHWDQLTILILATTILVSTITPLVIGQFFDIERRQAGRLAFQLLKYGEIPMLVYALYLLAANRIGDQQLADRFRLAMALLLVLHIILFTLATGAVILHTYLHFLNGRVCRGNNLLIAFLVLVNITEYLMWFKNWYLTTPATVTGNVLLWFYWVFVISYLGPVFAHTSAVRAA